METKLAKAYRSTELLFACPYCGEDLTYVHDMSEISQDKPLIVDCVVCDNEIRITDIES